MDSPVYENAGPRKPQQILDSVYDRFYDRIKEKDSRRIVIDDTGKKLLRVPEGEICPSQLLQSIESLIWEWALERCSKFFLESVTDSGKKFSLLEVDSANFRSSVRCYESNEQDDRQDPIPIQLGYLRRVGRPGWPEQLICFNPRNEPVPAVELLRTPSSMSASEQFLVDYAIKLKTMDCRRPVLFVYTKRDPLKSIDISDHEQINHAVVSYLSDAPLRAELKKNYCWIDLPIDMGEYGSGKISIDIPGTETDQDYYDLVGVHEDSISFRLSGDELIIKTAPLIALYQTVAHALREIRQLFCSHNVKIIQSFIDAKVAELGEGKTAARSAAFSDRRKKLYNVMRNSLMFLLKAVLRDEGDHVFIRTLNHKNSGLNIVCSVGDPELIKHHRTHCSTVSGHSGHVAQTGKCLIVNNTNCDVAANFVRRSLYDYEQEKSFAIFPILDTSGRSLGVVNFSSRHSCIFIGKKHLMSTISNAFAKVVEEWQSEENVREWNEASDFLPRLSHLRCADDRIAVVRVLSAVTNGRGPLKFRRAAFFRQVPTASKNILKLELIIGPATTEESPLSPERTGWDEILHNAINDFHSKYVDSKIQSQHPNLLFYPENTPDNSIVKAFNTKDIQHPQITWADTPDKGVFPGARWCITIPIPGSDGGAPLGVLYVDNAGDDEVIPGTDPEFVNSVVNAKAALLCDFIGQWLTAEERRNDSIQVFAGAFEKDLTPRLKLRRAAPGNHKDISTLELIFDLSAKNTTGACEYVEVVNANKGADTLFQSEMKGEKFLLVDKAGLLQMPGSKSLTQTFVNSDKGYVRYSPSASKSNCSLPAIALNGTSVCRGPFYLTVQSDQPDGYTLFMSPIAPSVILTTAALSVENSCISLLRQSRNLRALNGIYAESEACALKIERLYSLASSSLSLFSNWDFAFQMNSADAQEICFARSTIREMCDECLSLLSLKDQRRIVFDLDRLGQPRASAISRRLLRAIIASVFRVLREDDTLTVLIQFTQSEDRDLLGVEFKGGANGYQQRLIDICNWLKRNGANFQFNGMATNSDNTRWVFSATWNGIKSPAIDRIIDRLANPDVLASSKFEENALDLIREMVQEAKTSDRLQFADRSALMGLWHLVVKLRVEHKWNKGMPQTLRRGIDDIIYGRVSSRPLPEWRILDQLLNQEESSITAIVGGKVRE